MSNKTPAQTRKQLELISANYFEHLIDECLEQLKGFYFDPQSSALMPRFYEVLSEPYISDEAYSKLVADDKINPDCKKYIVAKATKEHLSRVLAESRITPSACSFILKNDNNWDAKLLNHYCSVYTDFGNDDLAILVDKLKVIVKLRNIIHPSADVDVSSTPKLSDLSVLKRFKIMLVNNKQILHQKRHPFADRLLNLMSILLFPIAIGRSIYCKLHYDKWNFMHSKGGLAADQMAKEITLQITKKM